MPYDPSDYDHPSVKLDRFLKAAQDQIGDRYRFGAEASPDDANPTAFDSSELVEWAAHRAGFKDMPDGSWNQYRYLHDAGASMPVEEALKIKGALVFGFSSDPLASADRPARAYVGISLGNGKVLDVSERTGEVRVLEPGDFYGYGATIPEFHAVDDTLPPPTVYPDGGDQLSIPGGAGPSRPPADPGVSVGPNGRIIHQDLPGPDQDPLGIPGGAGPSRPPADPGVSVGPNGRIIHQDLPGPGEDAGQTPPAVCYPDDPPPEEQVCYPDDDSDTTPLPADEQVCYPDDAGPTSQAEPAPLPGGDPLAAPGGAAGDALAAPGGVASDALAYAGDPAGAGGAASYGADPGYSTSVDDPGYPTSTDDYGDLAVDV